MSKQGRVLIPVELRRLLGLKSNEPLHAYAVEGELRIVSRRQGIRHAQAIAAKYTRAGVSVVDELICEKRDEAARE